MTAGYSVVVDFMGRPLLVNQAHQMHHRQLAPIRKGYRDGAATLARAQKIPHHTCIAVTAHAEYPTRRSLPDADAIAPSVKSILDGLVDAGVIDDDGPKYVRSVTYEAPRVVTGCTPAVVVEIVEVPPCGDPQPIPVRTGQEQVSILCGSCGTRTPVVADRRTARQVFDTEHGTRNAGEFPPGEK